jgi:hypothetical protein
MDSEDLTGAVYDMQHEIAWLKILVARLEEQVKALESRIPEDQDI